MAKSKNELKFHFPEITKCMCCCCMSNRTEVIFWSIIMTILSLFSFYDFSSIPDLLISLTALIALIVLDVGLFTNNFSLMRYFISVYFVYLIISGLQFIFDIVRIFISYKFGDSDSFVTTVDDIYGLENYADEKGNVYLSEVYVYLFFIFVFYIIAYFMTVFYYVFTCSYIQRFMKEYQSTENEDEDTIPVVVMQ